MIPKLSLPESGAASRIAPQDPEKLGTWLESNVTGDLLERLEVLTDALISLRQASLDPDRYLACLKMFREYARDIKIEVDKQNDGLSLPLPAAAIALSEALGDLYVQLCNGYKFIVLESADNPLPILKTSKLATACYSALHYVSKVLEIAYRGYHPYPPGVWYEIHQLYSFAVSEGIADRPVRCLERLNESSDNTQNAYVRVLLLHLCDPYQLPNNAIAQVQSILTEWGEMATINTHPTRTERTCMFLIDFEFDKPGLPFLSHSKFDDSGQHAILNTAPLVSALNSHIDQRLMSANGKWVDAGDSQNDLATIELLRSLIVKWGVQPVRSQGRIETNKPCDVISGINNVSLMINDLVPYIGDSETEEVHNVLADQMSADHKSGNQTSADPAKKEVTGDNSLPDNHPLAEPKNVVTSMPRPKAEVWTVIDESVPGMQLELTRSERVQVSVGDLVGIRVRGESDTGWILGVIRWAKNNSSHNARIGILKLGWPALPARMAAPSEELVPVILLPGNAELGRRQTVVAPKGLYAPNSAMRLKMNDRMVDAIATNLIISTPAGDCFEFDLK